MFVTWQHNNNETTTDRLFFSCQLQFLTFQRWMWKWRHQSTLNGRWLHRTKGWIYWFSESVPIICIGDMDFADFLNSVDLLIMGRKTFDQVISFGEDMWPYGDRQVWVWRRHPSLVNIPKIRASNVVALSEEPRELLRMAQQKGFRHVYVDGGTTMQQFLEKDCIDELILTRVPLLLGEGIPLFSETPRLSLEHVSTKSYSTA